MQTIFLAAFRGSGLTVCGFLSFVNLSHGKVRTASCLLVSSVISKALNFFSSISIWLPNQQVACQRLDQAGQGAVRNRVEIDGLPIAEID